MVQIKGSVGSLPFLSFAVNNFDSLNIFFPMMIFFPLILSKALAMGNLGDYKRVLIFKRWPPK